jgi:hypothetical protein
MLNARSIQGIVTLVAGIFIAIWLGMALVTSQFETLLKISGVALLLVCALLGQRVWLLMIFFSSANVVLMRGIGTTDISQLLFLAFAAVLFLMRKLRFEVRITELEVWALLIITCIVQSYMRNPTGLNVFGAGTVGGRPYVVLGLTIASSLVLSTLRTPANELKWAMRLTLLGNMIGPLLQMVRHGRVTTFVEGTSRIPALQIYGTIIARWLSSHMSPMRACLHPGWALVILASLAMAAGSGYRNAIAGVGLCYLIGILYHGGIRSAVASIIACSFALLLLALINLNFPLPRNIQRALSPFPGTWDERIVEDAENSSKWRVEMWKEALTSERWIQNKILGDGIGISTSQLEQNLAIDAAGIGRVAGGMTAQQENMLITGSYHSGPVHTIRMTGYVGLVVLVLAMIRLAVRFHRQIERCRGTEWFPVTLFFAIPQISHPIYFTLIFGEYHTAVAQLMLGIAMVRLLERNLPLPAYVVRSRRNYVPLVARNMHPANARSV